MIEAFLVHNSRTEIFPDMLFLQNDTPEQYLKIIFPEKSDDKAFKEIYKVHWVTVPIVQ